MENVIIYCRVSTDEQRNGASLDEQERQLRNYCETHDYNVIEIDHWEDESAKTVVGRPIMQSIIKYIKAHRGKVQKLLFHRWDRFSRDVFSGNELIRELLSYGVEPNAIDFELDYESDTWPLLLGTVLGLANGDNIKRAKATCNGIHGNLLRGHWTNKAPRGYKNVRTGRVSGQTHIEVDEGKAKDVVRAFKEVAKGLESPYRIRVNHFPYIKETSFFNMLRNVFYIGKVRVPAYKGEPEQIVNGEHEGIIEEATFYKVQEILDGKRKKSPKLGKVADPNLYLRKFLVCPVCGHSITGATSRGNGGKYSYYHCCDTPKHIRQRAEDVNQGFARYISCLKPNKAVLKLYNEILKEIRGEDKKSTVKEIETLKKEIADLSKRLEKADDKFLNDELDKDSYNRIVLKAKERQKELEERISMLQIENRKAMEPKLKYSIDLISNLGDFIENAPLEVKIKLLGSMFPQKIEYDGKKYRTTEYNQVLDLIYHETNKLRGGDNEKAEEDCSSSASVP